MVLRYICNMDINRSLTEVKKILELAIEEEGTVGKRNIIRTSQPIQVIHELVKEGLIEHGVKKDLIYPSLGSSLGEVGITGFIKKKNQDIVVIPEGVEQKAEYISDLEVLDPYGKNFSERILSINVRSQLSSVAKNFDTIFERTFAESFNLHQRLNKIVLGEVFLLPIREFEDSYSDQKIVKYRDLGNRVENQISKYVRYFNLINNRKNTHEDFHKYERVALLLVDFSHNTPKLYSSKEELIDDGIVSESFSEDIESLNFNSFFKDILSVYYERFTS